MRKATVSNKRGIYLTSFSMWANYLGLAVLIVPEILFAFYEIDTDPYLAWWAGVGLIFLGTIGRAINQGLSDD